jgi:type IV secretion system protein VirB8
MFRKKATTPNIENAVSQSINFEVTVADIARRSERRAWFVAWSAILMSLALAGGYYYMLPLKEKVPYIVMADAYTGTSTVAKLREDFNVNSIETSKVLNISNASHFVSARESFDYSEIGNIDWETVFVMSNSDVSSGYAALHSASNFTDRPLKLYGEKASVRIKILSTDISSGAKIDGVKKTAVVRFQRSLYDKQSGTTKPMDSRIATLEFVYKNNLQMTEPQRILNPLGFQVTSYRAVTDYASSPPLVGEAAPVFFSSQPPAVAPAVQPAQQPPPALDAQGNPMLPAGEPVPSAPQALPPGAQPPVTPAQPQPTQNPNPTNNANGAATR